MLKQRQIFIQASEFNVNETEDELIENDGAIKWNKFNLRSIILSFFDNSRMEDAHYF